jgi:hypothetical protein
VIALALALALTAAPDRYPALNDCLKNCMATAPASLVGWYRIRYCGEKCSREVP